MENAAPENLVTNALLQALNGAARALMDLDPDGKERLASLGGKVFCLEITAPPMVLHLQPTERGLAFSGHHESPADATLSGSAMDFVMLGLCPKEALISGRIAVRGDAELAQALQKILAELDLDWEELLARYIGDTPAHKVGNRARELADWAEKSAALARANGRDYLAEEKRILITPLAMERFTEQVNRIRADGDRLTQRVEKLQRALASSSHPPNPTKSG